MILFLTLLVVTVCSYISFEKRKIIHNHNIYTIQKSLKQKGNHFTTFKKSGRMYFEKRF
jgi:hypothetical protein